MINILGFFFHFLLQDQHFLLEFIKW